ncbi:aldehyde dehydrogenase family protein [Hoeflea prorocentri]|uniref:Aldehyde dehydrogenase family protein n=1 Tax=Hoeflea prorocentri TaxID=1922333 RepID=A0A9X3UFY2_9HYPH|nr:aldehyde dehydrogenase family protein [Hoeflea prorocentri]MCY6379820.1 aldehyde dehydrogenase family protein [Hoeflea prorocentri]MDA5397620.1 aldehyde dehydrogenase family protein [Hoeflea prorocentri]
MGTISLNKDVASFITSKQGLRIGSRQVETDGSIEVINPSNGKVLTEVARAGKTEVDLAVEAASRAFETGPWRTMGPDARSKVLWRFAELIEERADIFGQLDALDNGKPVNVARDVDAMWSARHIRYFAGWPDKIEGATIPVNIPDRLNYTLIEPVGVCGLITPWNYPLLMAAWKLAPALAAGNTVILKPSEETPLSALYLADLALEAGLPEGVLNVVPGLGAEAGAALAAHTRIAKIGFTGSTRTGRQIVVASKGNLKKVSLELGGKAANIIFADADLEKAIPGAFWANFGNNGQSCTAGCRLYVHSSIHDQVVSGLTEIADGLQVGPGFDDPPNDLGPVISERQMNMILGYVDGGRSDGAAVLTGGKRDTSEGWFIRPTIVADVTDDMKLARDEIFGPVISVLKFDDEEDVLKRANDTDYGLAAGLWSQDVTRVRRMAGRLQAGTIWVNCWGETDAASPFGGMKQSGYGREMGREAIALYSQTKSVWVA